MGYGKIKRRMDRQEVQSPPSLMRALMAGFDAISNHIGLILFSVLLDGLLWLGPHLRISPLIKTYMEALSSLMDAQPQEQRQALQASQEVLRDAAQNFNLLSVLRSYPVGIPSLMAGYNPTEMPIGEPSTWSIGSPLLIVGLWLLLSLCGLIAGALYFHVVAQAALDGEVRWRDTLSVWPWASLQVVLLAIFLLLILFGASLPFLCLLSLFAFAGFGPGQFVMLLIGAVIVWSLLPLAFSPHGIFVFKQKMWAAVKHSVRVIRMTLPTTGLFFLAVIVLTQGLDYLWSAPPETSWWTLIGILGHAFISTGLLAASFIYYYDASLWMQNVIQQAKSVKT